MIKKLLLLFICTILIVGTVSAWEFDNKKAYDEGTKTATFTNSFAGIFPLDEIGSAKLISGKSRSGFPDDYIFEIEFNLNEDYGGAIDNFELYDMKRGMEQIDSPTIILMYYDLNSKTDKEETRFNPLTNQTEVKLVSIIGEWKELNSLNDLPSGKTIIRGYYPEMNVGERIEWIPELFGVKVTEWADFSAFTPIEYYNVSDNGATAIQNNICGGQTFTVGTVGSNQMFNLTGFVFKAWTQSNPPDSGVTIRFRNVNATNLPTGSDLATVTIPADDLGGDPGFWHNYTTNTSSLFQPDTTYAVTLCIPGAGTVQWKKHSGGSYAGGNVLDSSDTGGSWAAGAGDMMFEVWGTEIPDALNVTVNLISPGETSSTSDNYQLFESNFTSLAGNLTNATLYMWDSNGSVYGTNYTTVTGNSTTNSTTRSLSSLPLRPYVWNFQACVENATDSVCDFSSTNRTLNVLSFTENSNTFNTSAFELTKQQFIINLTSDAVENSSAQLYWNGTLIGNGTKNNTVGTTTTFVKSFDIPLIDNNTYNMSFNWVVTINGGDTNSTVMGQVINRTILNLCNGTGVEYYNITFKDQVNSSNIFGKIPTSTFQYYPVGGNVSINRSFSFSNNTANQNYSFCFYPRDMNITNILSLDYSASGYPQRSYNPDAFSLSNTTTLKELYLLSTSDGIYVTFQVINTAEQPISGVDSNATTSIGGTPTIVGSGTTGDDGGITYWLNPNNAHTFNFYINGYDLYTTTLTPTQTSYTVSLGGESATTSSDYSLGISYSIEPTDKYLYNDTSYEFNYTLTSDYWTVTDFGFRLVLPNDTEIGDTSTSANGGMVDTSVNTLNYTQIIMNYYYVIDGNYTNSSISWIILSEEDLDFSILKFFTDLSTYLTSGLFGLDSFGLNLIIYVIIFVFTGIMSYKFGVNNPAAISLIVLGLVALFDVGLGILSVDTTIPAMTHFPTVLMTLITVGLFFREVYR